LAYRVARSLGSAPGPADRIGTAMSDYLSHLGVPIAIGAVAVVLVIGLANTLRGGSPNLSQRLMRLRVLLQFIAIIIVMVTIWMLGR
jgi:Hypoxia induced protein conserved region